MTRRLCAIGLAVAACLNVPALARESLGIYAGWGAFRDPVIPRCYAIAMAEPNAAAREYQPFAAVGTWPRRGARGQVHFRLSRRLAQGAQVTLSLGGQRFDVEAREGLRRPGILRHGGNRGERRTGGEANENLLHAMLHSLFFSAGIRFGDRPVRTGQMLVIEGRFPEPNTTKMLMFFGHT